MKKIVCFGEIMLRLNPEGYLRFAQADRFEVSYGGGEANAAVSLANYGDEASFVTKLPDNPLGQCAVNALRRYGVGILSRKFDLPVYATPGTWLGMAAKLGAISEKNRRTIETETHFFLGDVDVVAFSTPHDALEPCGFRFENGAARFALATDIGCVREGWLKYVAGCDAVLLESNYDPDMLKAGPYPYDLKKRILSRRGHLSNDDAGETAGELSRFHIPNPYRYAK